MPRKTKYVKGEPICDLDQFVSILDAGQWVYWCDRPKHPGFLASMRLRVLQGAVRSGILHLAVERASARICDHAKVCTYEPCLHRFAHVCRPGAVRCYGIQAAIECVLLEAQCSPQD